MTAHSLLRQSTAFSELLAASARLGQNPLQVQGPGGNTSLKGDGAMWVKASGTWLADAEQRDIMVPVDLTGLRAALAAGERPADACVLANINPHGLRGSIETAVHAALDWPVVLHTHCVATIAAAVRADAETFVSDCLKGFEACFVPYEKPGWDLSAAITARASEKTNVVVLGSHGLVTCGRTVAEAEALLFRVSEALEPQEIAPALAASPALKHRLTAGWQAAPENITHALALDPLRLAMADRATLYPDHAIFLGPGVVVAKDTETADQAASRAAAGGPARKLVLFPGLGAALPADASAAQKAMARCLGDVLARVPIGTPLRALTGAEEADLLNWDAEKYRQSMDKAQ